MDLGGRPHVDPFAPLATEPAVGRSEDASRGVHHDDAKAQAEASFADLWDPTDARSLAPQTSGAPQQKGSGEAEDSFEDLYRDLDSPTGERPLVPLASRGTGEQMGSGEAEATFADLSRDLDASTGERPLVPQGRGVVLKLAPTPAAEPPGSMAGPEEEAARPAPPAAVAAQVPLPAKKPALAPRGGGQGPALLGAAVVLAVVAGGAGWLYLRSGAAPARSHSAVAAAPATRASPSPRPPSPTEPSPRGRAVSEEHIEEDIEVPADEEIAAKGPPDPRAPAKRKPADRQPSARKVARPLPQAKAAEPPAAPAPKPESRPEPPRVAVATGLAPGQAPSAVAPAGGPLEATPAPPPQASNADLAPLDEGKVEATFALHMRDFEACVADARANEPGLALDGRSVTITMTVNPNGRVVYPTLDDAALSGTGLGNCIKRESAKIQFPAFGGGSIRLRKSIALK